jgi:hypothetical protein
MEINEPVVYQTLSSNSRQDYILKKRLIDQYSLLQYGKYANLNIDTNKINYNKKNEHLKNKVSKELFLTTDNNDIEKHVKSQYKPTQLFSNQFNKSKSYRKQFIDQPAINLNRFYDLYKNPQINCIEPFIRGGHNSVLETLDNFSYEFNC